ncbi:hypothetical protein EK904_011949 [Melospiza melodia maxima]|nr:hypothetical protein EK904_011949 [Melospiza melodia maxima]
MASLCSNSSDEKPDLSAFSLPSFISPSQSALQVQVLQPLSDPKQHMILVKSQVTQCYSTPSSSAPARQEERTVRNTRQGKARNEMGQGGSTDSVIFGNEPYSSQGVSLLEQSPQLAFCDVTLESSQLGSWEPPPHPPQPC